jgi:hypothetical protein
MKISSQNQYVQSVAIKQRAEGFGYSTTVAQAVVKMRKGIKKSQRKNRALEIGSNADLRQTESLLRSLDTLILPELEDALQASLSSMTRQTQTYPERCKGLTQSNVDHPNENPYAAVIVSQSLLLTTSITKLCESTVIIVGLNGTGSKLATLLARRGLGHLILFDPFHVGPKEWQHNLEFTPSMTNLSKTRAVCGIISELNADTKVEAICCDVRDPMSGGATLLAHCMKTGTTIVPANYEEKKTSTSTSTNSGINNTTEKKESNKDKRRDTIKVHVLDVPDQDKPPRQIKTRLTYVNRLPVKQVDLTPTDVEDSKDFLPHKRNNSIVVVCCDEDLYTRSVVGELAMEHGLTTLFDRPPHNKWTLYTRNTSGVSRASGESGDIELVTTTTSVVPGVTACLQCITDRSRSHYKYSHKKSLPIPPRSPLPPASSCSPATRAIMASTLCQTTLRALLSNMQSNKSVTNSEFSPSNDRIEAASSEKPSRKCKSIHCRSQQHGNRKNLRRQQMRKVLKVSNMFAWTKRKSIKSDAINSASGAEVV